MFPRVVVYHLLYDSAGNILRHGPFHLPSRQPFLFTIISRYLFLGTIILQCYFSGCTLFRVTAFFIIIILHHYPLFDFSPARVTSRVGGCILISVSFLFFLILYHYLCLTCVSGWCHYARRCLGQCFCVFFLLSYNITLLVLSSAVSSHILGRIILDLCVVCRERHLLLHEGVP